MADNLENNDKANEDKQSLQFVIHIVSRGNKIYSFIKKYWYLHTVLALGLGWSYTQFNEIKKTEQEIAPIRDSIKMLYYYKEYMLKEMYKHDSTLNIDRVLINDMYWYKFPYNKYGDTSKSIKFYIK